MSAATALYRRLLVYLRPHVPALILGTALALVVAAMEGAVAWLVKPAMDDIFIRRDLTRLKVIPLLFLGAYVFKGAARYGQSYLMAAVGERVIAKLRHDLYAHIQRMELSFFAHHHSAELMSRIVADVNRLAELSDSGTRTELERLLGQFAAQLCDLANAVTRRYLVHAGAAHQMAAIHRGP